MSQHVQTENGSIFAPDAMYMHVHVGKAKDAETNNEYELQTNMSSCPIIVSKKTGQSWHCSWLSLLALAVKDGIDTPQDFTGGEG
ncbi:MAG: hypothetical protein JNM58_00625 [Xanthomonadaceae bacterium]|nr:hypothetical protein [Xanthomonadaceae bacterium]